MEKRNNIYSRLGFLKQIWYVSSKARLYSQHEAYSERNGCDNILL